MIARLARDTRGGVGIAVAAALPVLVGISAFAVDLGAIQLDTRRLQGLADAAALAAASNPEQAQAGAQALVDASGWPRAIRVRATSGAYAADPALPSAMRFTAGSFAPDAARVELESASPTFLAAILGIRSVPIARRATAARQRFAAFSIGSRLASVNGGLLNRYLGALTGSNVSLSVMEYESLARAEVDLFGYLPRLRTAAGLTAGSYGAVLDSQVTTPQALAALAATLDADGQGGAASATRALAGAAAGRTITLSALLDAGPFARQQSGATGIARVDALAFATALLQLGGGSRQVAFDLDAGVPGVAALRVSLAVGERERQSPWIAVTDRGTPIVRTAQARLYLRARLLPVALPGLGTPAAIDLPIFVELASAEGRLTSVDCATAATRGVTIEAKPDIGQAAIGTVNEALLPDFGTPIVPATAKLIDTLLVDVTGSSRIDIGTAEPWQPLRFDTAEIAAGTRKTVRSSHAVAGIATSLATQATLQAQVLGLPIAVDPLLRAVGGILSGVAPGLDSLIGLATGTLGVGLGEADVRVIGMRCGTAVLVG